MVLATAKGRGEIPRGLVEPSGVGAERSEDERTGHVDAAHHPMQLCVAHSQAIEELHGRKYQRRGASNWQTRSTVS
jgi:hypothetical protein